MTVPTEPATNPPSPPLLEAPHHYSLNPMWSAFNPSPPSSLSSLVSLFRLRVHYFPFLLCTDSKNKSFCDCINSDCYQLNNHEGYFLYWFEGIYYLQHCRDQERGKTKSQRLHIAGLIGNCAVWLFGSSDKNVKCSEVGQKSCWHGYSLSSVDELVWGVVRLYVFWRETA